jgi:hypothetical protein
MSVASTPVTNPSYQFPVVRNLVHCVEKFDLGSLSQEPQLALLRHPDHVGSPDVLTYKFTQHYSEMFQAGFAKTVNAQSAHWVTGVDHRKFVLWCDKRDRSGDFAAMNSARQFADRTGLHYAIFLKYCFQFTMVRGWTWLPRPHQLIPAKTSKHRASFDRGLAALIQREIGDKPRVQINGFRSCYGIVGAHGQSPVCEQCPTFSACAKLCAEVLALAPTSLQAKRRAQNSARQARYKLRKKAEKILQ